MPDYYAQHAASLKTLQRNLGAGCPQFGWPLGEDGAPENWYACLPGGSDTGKTLGPGGWATDASVDVLVLAADFAANPPASKLPTGVEPQLKQTCVVSLGPRDTSPVRRRIDAVVYSPGRDFLQITCVDPTRGV